MPNTRGFRINAGDNFTDRLKFEAWRYGAWNLDKHIHLLTTRARTANQQLHDANAAQNLIIWFTPSF